MSRERKVDGVRKAHTDNPVKAEWYKICRTVRYSRHFKGLSGQHEEIDVIFCAIQIMRRSA